MGKKKTELSGTFSFIFCRKVGVSEDLFNYYYSSPLLIGYPHIKNKPPNIKFSAKQKSASSSKPNLGGTNCYFADFNYDTCRLNIKTQCEDKFKELSDKDGREMFRNYASFKEILDSIQPILTEDNILAYKTIFKKNLNFEEAFNLGLSGKKMEQIPDENTKAKAALSLLRDHPYCIDDKKIAFIFINIMEKARWDSNSKIRKEAIKLLKDYLIPQHKKGEIPVPPGCSLALPLLKELAKYLSLKCKLEVDIYANIKRGDSISKDDYNHLIDWARGIKEFRISTLSHYALNRLILNPSDFTENLLEVHLKTCIKTITRHEKKTIKNHQ